MTTQDKDRIAELERVNAELKRNLGYAEAAAEEQARFADEFNAQNAELRKALEEIAAQDWNAESGHDAATELQRIARAALSATPADSQQAKDAERYRVLRDSKYQRQEDDPCVTDDSFNTFFDEDLDKAVDALKARYDAIDSALSSSEGRKA